MNEFLQNWIDTIGQDLSFMVPIVEELMQREHVDLMDEWVARRTLRDACVPYSNDFTFHWAVMSYFEDMKARFKG